MITAFLPCCAGSQRVPQKNTRPFAGREDGLLGIKLEQLLATTRIDRVMLSTNDPLVLEIGERHRAGPAGDRLVIDRRPDHLCSSATSTDEVIGYVPSVIPDGDVLWTHVTSPFFGPAEYDAAVDAYVGSRSEGHDSLMGVNRLMTFLWNAKGPVNYDRTQEKWPRTQTLQPLWEVNSAIFIAPVDIYRTLADRVGAKPLLYEIEKEKTVDIDWPDDFTNAERLWLAHGG